MPTTAPKTITTDADLTDRQIVTQRVTLIADDPTDADPTDPTDHPTVTSRAPFTEAERADRYRARLVFLYWDAVDAYLQQQRQAGRVPTKRGAVRAAQAAKRAAAKRGRS